MALDTMEQYEAGRGEDTANQALFDALRLSFRVLKVIMAIAIVAYLASGTFQVQQGEVALVTRFGKVLGAGPDQELKQGLHWSLPWPINGHIRVPKGPVRTTAAEFWYQVSEQERVQGRSMAAGFSLVPGKDDFVMTGDANILHVNMTVNYGIVNAYDYVRSFADAETWDPNTNPNVQPEAGLIRALADTAVIRAAGGFKVDDLLGAEKTKFAAQVKDCLQQSLRAANCGLELRDVLIGKIEPPRQVVTDFNAVLGAWQERHAAIVKAQSEADQKLIKLAGEGYKELAGAIMAEQKLQRANDPKLAEARKNVSQMLEQSPGSVQEILGSAKSHRTRVVETAKADAKNMEALLPRYLENPRVVMTRLLLGMLETTLDHVQKYYIPRNTNETWFYIDRDTSELKMTDNAAGR